MEFIITTILTTAFAVVVACVIVVSEETGNISFVKDGEIKTMGSISELRLAIENSYKE